MLENMPRMHQEGVRLNTLADLTPGQSGIIEKINGDISLKRQLSALGMVKGTKVALERTAPMGDPRAYFILGYQLSLRNEDARKVILHAAD